MRKLFGAIITIAVILAFTRVLLGNREQQSISAANNHPSVHPPQISYEETQSLPDSSRAEADDGNGVTPLLVNAWNPLPDGFTAGELVTLFDYKDRQFSLSTSDIQLDKTVYLAADAMFAAAKQDGVDGFIITSGYRGRDKQEELYNGSNDGTVARPGHSEHETGLAFDVTVMGSSDGFDTTPQFEWLYENCWDYGFILRYPKGKEHITGIPYEPWHYRYVGVPHSREIRGQNITLEEHMGES